MSELYNIVISYAKQYPILIPFVIFGFFYLKNAQFRKFTNKTVVKFFRISFSSQLFAHDLFFQKNLWYIQIQRVHFSSDAKTKLFRILLYEKVNAVLSVTETYLKENKKMFKNAHPAELSALLLRIVYTIIETYEKAILRKYIELYGPVKGAKLYKLVYVQNFKPQHEINVHAIERKIARLPYSSSKNIDDVMRSYLSKLQDATNDAIDDCEDAFAQINGGIDKIIEEKENSLEA
jgi:hypothetical protein